MDKISIVSSYLSSIRNKRLRFARFKIILPVLALILLFNSSQIFGQAVSQGTAPVIPPTGKFAIDGNLRANTPVIGVGDWLPATGAGGAVLDATGIPLNTLTTFHAIDLYNSGDNIFEGGQKKNDNPNSMTWKAGNPSPAKCDINNLLLHIADDPVTGDTWITLSGDRESVNGNSFISLALHQKKLVANANGTFTSDASNIFGGRSPGDVQVSAEFTGGGSNPNLYLEEWKLLNGVYQWVAFSITPMPAFGSTNAAILTGVPYDAFGSDSYPINAFIEVSFNVTEIYKNVSTPCVGSIASLFVLTKSSQAEKADLTDFMTPLQINLDINVGKPTANGATYCVGQPIQNLTVTGEQGATFNWYTAVDANGKPTGTPTTGSTYTPVVDNTVAGTTSFYVTQLLKGCESQPTKVDVVVNANATASAGSAPAAQCADAVNGNTFNLTGSGSNGTPSWAVAPAGNPASLTVVITNGSTYTPSVKVTGGVGSVTLRLTVTSGFTPQCGTPTSDVTVTVNPNATASAGSAPAAQCYNSASGSTFNLSGSGSNGNPSWAVAPGGNPANLTVQITDDNTYTPSVNVSGGPGTVTLRLTVTSTTVPACGNPTNNVSVTVNPLPTANAGTDPSTQCYNASGNVFNLTGTGLNGTPSWAIAPNGNPGNLNVDISGDGTLTPSVTLSGNTGGGTVTLRLTVTSNTTPACGNATDDVDLIVGPQVGAPDAVMLTPLCTDKTFKVQVNSPDAGTTYTATQPLNNNNYSSSFSYDGTNGPVVFTGLTFGDGFTVTASKNGCTSAALNCPLQTNSLTPLTQAAPTVNASIAQNDQSKVLAYPNPYNDQVKFNLQSAVSGQGSLELYNMMGQKVATVYSGFIQAGSIQTVHYNVPFGQRANFVYVFKVNNQRITGKLINVKR